MDDNRDFFINAEDEEMKALILRFEKSVELGESSFFDIDEFSDIIDFYTDIVDDEMAMKAIDMAELQHPENDRILLKKAYFLAHSQSPEVELLLSAVEKIKIDDPDMYFVKAEIYTLMDKHEKAIEVLQKALDEIDDVEYVYSSIANSYGCLGLYDKSIEYRKLALNENPDSAISLISLQHDYESSQKIEEGVVFFQRLCEENPMGQVHWYIYANLLFTFGLHEKAMEAIEYALAIDPKYTRAMQCKASFYSALNEYEKAIEVYQEIVFNHPGETMFLVELANCYENLERYECALSIHKRAICINPYNSYAWYGVSICQYELGNFSDAYTSIKYLLHNDPGNPDAWNLYGEYLFELDKYELAIEAFEKACDIEPENPSFLASILLSYIELGKVDKAQEILAQSSSLALPQQYMLSAILYFKQNLFDEMEGALSVSLMMDKKCIEILEDTCPEILESLLIKKLVEEHIPDYYKINNININN